MCQDAMYFANLLGLIAIFAIQNLHHIKNID